MYPKDFFDTYWRSEIRNEVFVAMPFHDEFQRIWDEAIFPGVADVPPLTARRVDSTILSGSIVTDILDGIAHSRIVLADISIAETGRWVGQRNGNVMYEVGLAHAVRQTTEIVLLRSDAEPINFDLAQINIHKYDKTDLAATRKLITRIVSELINQIKQEKSLKVKKAIEQLDNNAKFYIGLGLQGEFLGPDPKNMGEALVSISNKFTLSRLQELGIVRANPIPDAQTAYSLSPFGLAVARGMGIRT